MSVVAEAVVVDPAVFVDLVVGVPGRLAEAARCHAGEVGEEEPGRDEADHLAHVGRVWTYFFLIGAFGARSTRWSRAGSAGPGLGGNVWPGPVWSFGF
ncbi:MAG: hypothetical protein WDA16_00310 [Candidatus Thermoplasmatota archaeon]